MHAPVMVDEVLRALKPRRDGIYVDCTFGRGGHASALLQRLGPAARLLGLDKDPEAVAAGGMLAARDSRFTMEPGSFNLLGAIAEQHGIGGKVQGLLFDLGVSSPQLDDASRGFSFRADGSLDMRMNPALGMSAATWLGSASVDAIADVLRRLGEERYAKRIARAIDAARLEAPIDTTRRLADIVASAVPATRPRRKADRRPRGTDKHPATRTFQAVRIFVNRELEELEEALAQTVDVLATGGRLVVVSFHSLEDRIVKRFIRAQSQPPPLPPGLPVREPDFRPRLRAVGKAQRPTREEVAANPRARSAVLRTAEKCA